MISANGSSSLRELHERRQDLRCQLVYLEALLSEAQERLETLTESTLVQSELEEEPIASPQGTLLDLFKNLYSFYKNCSNLPDPRLQDVDKQGLQEQLQYQMAWLKALSKAVQSELTTLSDLLNQNASAVDLELELPIQE